MEIDEAPPPNILQTLWVQDEDVRACKDCKGRFTLVNRRHHCRRCMEIFCAKCSANHCRLKLHGYPSEDVRVCNKCLYEAGKENEYADKYLGVVRKGVRLMLYPSRKVGEKEPVIFRLDNAFPQFLVERADIQQEVDEVGPKRGIAIIDMAVIRPAADAPLCFEITTRNDTVRLEASSEEERSLWVDALKETKTVYMKERPFERRAKQVGRIVQAKEFWHWVETGKERRKQNDPFIGTVRGKKAVAPTPSSDQQAEAENGDLA